MKGIGVKTHAPRRLRIFAGFFAMVFAVTATASAAPVDEIEALLHFLAGLDGATFIRNGDAHTPAEAEAHLRMKWTKQKSEIASAEDFIRLCGTKSSVSGEPYVIRFKDGHEEEAGRVLRKQLDVIRTKPRPASDGAGVTK